MKTSAARGGAWRLRRRLQQRPQASAASASSTSPTYRSFRDSDVSLSAAAAPLVASARRSIGARLDRLAADWYGAETLGVATAPSETPTPPPPRLAARATTCADLSGVGVAGAGSAARRFFKLLGSFLFLFSIGTLFCFS